jgi:integrase
MLTAKRIEQLKKKPGRYRDDRGLYLRVFSPRNAGWVLRYERHGRERMMSLGPLHTVTLAQARERARDARLLLLDGVDPLEQKKSLKAERALQANRALTFEEAARQYFDQHEKKWRNPKHRAQFISTLNTYAFPKIGKLAVGAVDTGQILRVLEQKHADYPDTRLWEAVPETANRVRGRVEAILDWATVRGLRTGDNPARWRGHLANVLPARAQIQKPQHHAALPYSELPKFMTALNEREGIAAKALAFTILTAARTSESIGARWDEIDLKAKTWTVPAGRIKGGREHRVPLSDRALQLLKALPHEEDNAFVFIGPRSNGLSNMAMANVLDRMGRGDITVHGFRSCFMDWAHEQTAYAKVVIDQALAHVVGDKVEAAYRRGDLFDKRRRLMADWGKYCAQKPATKSANVVSLHGARA